MCDKFCMLLLLCYFHLCPVTLHDISYIVFLIRCAVPIVAVHVHECIGGAHIRRICLLRPFSPTLGVKLIYKRRISHNRWGTRTIAFLRSVHAKYIHFRSRTTVTPWGIPDGIPRGIWHPIVFDSTFGYTANW